MHRVNTLVQVVLKSVKKWLRYKGNKHWQSATHKPMQGCAKKINKNYRKNNFVAKFVTLKDHIGRVGDVSKWYSQGWFTVR